MPVARPNQAVSSLINQLATVVQRFDLFAGIALSDCAQIVSAARERDFVPRKTIFLEGDPIRHVVLLLSGCVKVTQLGPNRQEVILRLSGPGEMVGALGLLAGYKHWATARTTERSSALIWECSQFEDICERFPVLGRNAVRVIEQRLNDIEVRFREVSTERVSPRLSSQMVRLLSQMGKHTDGEAKIALSRQELAQLTGTTLFTVSRLLCHWETRRIVSARRKAVVIRDLPALLRLSHEE